MKKILALLLSVVSLLTFGQWDNIQTKTHQFNTLSSVYDANSDINNNVYIRYNHPNEKEGIAKYDANNTLTWSKSLFGHDLNTTSGNSIEFNGNNSEIFICGSENNKGKILSTPNSNVSSTINWETFSGTASSKIESIKVDGNDMYIVGTYWANFPNQGGTITFDNGGVNTTTLTNLSTSNTTYTFVAKYSVAPKQLLWVKSITSSGNSVKGSDLDIDNSGNIYVTGHFTNTMTLSGITIPASNGTNSFLLKLDNQGNYDSAFGVKQHSNASGNTRHVLKIHQTSGNIASGQKNSIASYNSNGGLLWTSNLTTTTVIYELDHNSCGDVIATGHYHPGGINNAKFHATILDKNSGTALWSTSLANSQSAQGIHVLTNQNNEAKFVGYYHNNLTIDNLNYTSPTNGLFFATLANQNINSCCNYAVDLGSDLNLCSGTNFPQIDITGQGFDTGFSIGWYIGPTLVQSGGTVFSNTSILANGGVLEVRVYTPGCKHEYISDQIVVTVVPPIVIDLPSIFYNCEGNELEICGPTPPMGVLYTYNWGLVDPNVNLGTNPCFIPTQPGNYSLTITDNFGCHTATHFFTISNNIPTPDLGPDIIACIGDHHGLITIANQGFDNTNTVIQWYQGGNLIQTGGTTLQMSYTASVNISVVVTIPGCEPVRDDVRLIFKICCPDEVQINMIYCPGQDPIFHIIGQGYGDDPTVTITWLLDGDIIQIGGEILQGGYPGDGILTVSISKKGCENLVIDNMVIGCEFPDPEGRLKTTSKSINLDVYPNPTSGLVSLILDQTASGKLTILGLDGKIIISESFSEQSRLKADLTQFERGTYIAKITTDNETIVEKVVKQ
ncbi:MAG: T9SS type A sorting domain-containing protein [Crocinitomicaceae bacterium]